MNFEIYSQLVSKSLPIIEAYHNDLLLHDYNAIKQAAENTPFLHFTRHCGTHIVLLHGADSPLWPGKDEKKAYLFDVAGREHMLRGVREVAQYAVESSETKLCLYFDGNKLMEIDKETALAVAKNHVSNVLRDWRKQEEEENLPCCEDCGKPNHNHKFSYYCSTCREIFAKTFKY